MILATHAVVGASVARLASLSAQAGGNLPLAFGLGFLSHFLLDALPHWDYKLRSREHPSTDPLADRFVIGRAFVGDLAKIGLDFGAGVLLAVWLIAPADRAAWFLLSVGILGGVLPDVLQFVYYQWRWRPLSWLQRLHLWLHTDWRLDGQWLLGAVSQLVLILGLNWLIVFLLR